MRRVRILLITLVGLAVFGFSALPAYAQGSNPVTVDVDRNSLSTDEILVLTVTVDTAQGNPSEPVMPTLDGFRVLGRSSGTQMSLVNGDFSMKATYQYRLQPNRAGDLVIEPISVAVGGQNYITAPITVNVTQGTGALQPAVPRGRSLFPSFPSFPTLPALPGAPGAPAAPPTQLDPSEAPTDLAGQDYFVEAEVDDQSPYVGEQVVYTLRFYQGAQVFGQTQYSAPGFTGFWSSEQPEQVEYSLQVAGRNYRVTELKTLLFPSVVGEANIEPAGLNIPGDFFSAGQSLRTQPIALNVQPLPENPPASFKGAVGQFEILAEADRLETTVNEPVTLKVTLHGQGNIETMGDPLWAESADWRSFDSQAEVQSQFSDGVFGGSRVYEIVMVPTTPGRLVLPAIEYSYFDRDTAEYVTITTEPIPITVASDGAIAAPPAQAAADLGADPAVVTSAPSLQPLKPPSPTWSMGSALLTQQAGYWLLWSVPLVMLAGYGSRRWWQTHRHNNVDLRRRQGAARKAQRALHQSRKNDDEPNSSAGRILNVYLADKLGRSVTGLTLTELTALLQERNVDQALMRRVDTCLTLSEMGRYAPDDASSPKEDILAETEELIKELDLAFGRKA